MSHEIQVNVAKDFSRFPAGRYKIDGPYSGEAFRDLLVPYLRNSRETLSIELDGALGYGSSFLEEAFGGLIRIGFAAGDLMSRLKFHSTDESLVREIRGYITRAA